MFNLGVLYIKHVNLMYYIANKGSFNPDYSNIITQC